MLGLYGGVMQCRVMRYYLLIYLSGWVEARLSCKTFASKRPAS
jgi:hypothetical protein